MVQTNKTPWQSVFRANLFLGKVALVTGGGTGIGRAIALELATLGATTVIASRDQDKCQLAAEEMNRQLFSGCKGKIISGPSCSIRKEEDVKHLVR
jgi:peroxisomal trans-2-enoyl-CoA reductase